MIINRYLICEISKPLTGILSMLVVLFASYSANVYLSDAVSGLLPTDTIAQLLGLKVLISLEVLIPISLYLSVVVALGRLYSDSELTVMFALRVTPTRVMGAVLTLAGLLALVVAGLSLAVRPWAYQRSHELSKQAEASINFKDMEAGTFYEDAHGNRVIFIGQRDGLETPAKNVFVLLKFNHKMLIGHAQQARQQQSTELGGGPKVHLHNAHIYEIGGKKSQDNEILNLKNATLNLGTPDVKPPGYSSLAASSAKLASSGLAKDIAEFQWRLSAPLSTLLLAMLGVPLSRARPQQGKYAKMTTAVLIYSGYYLLCTSARTWVENGEVAKFPGIWWAPALLALVLIIALFGSRLNLRFKR